MNCRNFEITIAEVARDQMLEARSKEDALAHMKECQRCRASFADQQALTAGLRAVAASAVLNEAPARLEATLLSAFRQRGTASFIPVIAPPVRQGMPRWSRWSLAAAAAAILVVTALTIPRLLSKQPTRQEARIDQPASLPLTAKAPEEIESPDPQPQPASVEENPGQEFVSYPSPRPINRRRGLINDAVLNDRPVRGVNNSEAANTNEEIATDFLPLTYGGNLSQLDGGQVVRVELPRSALQSFGLPMNAERAGERVKADVLLGHDGVARAIRFVR